MHIWLHSFVLITFFLGSLQSLTLCILPAITTNHTFQCPLIHLLRHSDAGKPRPIFKSPKMLETVCDNVQIFYSKRQLVELE